jgi:hypothetical protein
MSSALGFVCMYIEEGSKVSSFSGDEFRPLGATQQQQQEQTSSFVRLKVVS